MKQEVCNTYEAENVTLLAVTQRKCVTRSSNA